MSTLDLAETVTPAEIADMAGVLTRTVYTWVGRRKAAEFVDDKLPEADYPELNRWDRGTVVLWLAATGRLERAFRPLAEQYADDRFEVSLAEYVETTRAAWKHERAAADA